MGIDEFGDSVKCEDKRNQKTALLEAPCAPMEMGGCDEKKRESDKLKKTQWAITGSGVYTACATTEKKLPSGAYSIQVSESGYFFVDNPLNIDDLIDFPDSVFDKVIQEVEGFWSLGDRFKSYGFLHRRGYLFYGPAGGGKSCLTQRIIQDVIRKDGVVFICNGRTGVFSDGLKIFREVEPDRKVLCVFEDIDAIIERAGESDLLSLLDGENQVNKVVNIATTNYPERLDKRIVARPRRFDQLLKVGMPNASIRKVYFEKKLHINGDDIEKWVAETEGLSFAALAEMVISVKCLGHDFSDSAARLKDLITKKVSSGDFDAALGFKVGNR
jgi:hypothetical protein